MKKELEAAFEYTIKAKEQKATVLQLKSLKEFQDQTMYYVKKVSKIMIMQKKNENPLLEQQLTFECRSLFVDLYKAMHENLDGIKLLGNSEYKMVLEVLLSFSFRLTNGLHEIEGQ